MTTDDKDLKKVEEKSAEEATKDNIDKSKEEKNNEPELSDSEKAMVDKMTTIFTDKVNEITTKYDKKIEDLNTSIAEKDKEIAKLRKVNSEILMSTDLRGNKKDDIDFNNVDFSEVDWDKEAQGLLNKIDKKIS